VFVAIFPRVCAATPPTEEQLAEPPKADSSAPRATRRWYGLQTFSTDAAAGAMFLGAIAANHNDALFGLSALTFGVGAPAIHVAHGNWEVSLASVGLRTFSLLCGTLIGGSYDDHGVDDTTASNQPSDKWMLVGAGIGGLLASATDGLLLAYDTRVPKPPPERNQLLSVNPFPQVVVLRRGAGLGYSGQF
jgi:hypothetical protein